MQPFSVRSSNFASMIWIIACFTLISCTSTPSRNTSNDLLNLEPAPVITEPPARPQPTRVDVPSTPPSTTNFSRGIYLSEYSPGSINTLLEQNGAFPIHHIILANPDFQAIDDVLFQSGARSSLQQTASIAQAQNIATYFWSREIHIEGSSFVFSNEAPLVAARQTAYRSLLRTLPELDGIVISFEDALLPPWQAQSLLQNNSMLPEEKVRFIIQMLTGVVIEEFGKQLIIAVPEQEPDSTYILNAVRSIDDRRLQLITSSSSIAARSPINDTIKIHRLVDISGNVNAGSFAALHHSMIAPLQETTPAQHAGITVKVGIPGKYVWNTSNGINWQAFTTWSPGIQVHDTVWDQWIQQSIGTSPVSDEGRLLRSIIENGTYHSKSIAQNMVDMGIIQASALSSQPDMDTISTAQFLSKNMDRPTIQMLTDLAQSQYETIEWTVQTLKEVDQILQPVMRQPVYQDLQSRVQHLYWNTLIQHFISQSILGFQLWKNTRSEQEALYLESHLLELEKIISNPQSASSIDPKTAAFISQIITSIRNEFPRVLVGSKPRLWNKISGVRVQQANANEAILYWQTDTPARSRIFLSVDPPHFNRVVDGDNRDVVYHQAVIRDINPDQEYYVRIQCVTEDGRVTNSGIFPLKLKSISL